MGQGHPNTLLLRNRTTRELLSRSACTRGSAWTPQITSDQPTFTIIIVSVQAIPNGENSVNPSGFGAAPPAGGAHSALQDQEVICGNLRCSGRPCVHAHRRNPY